MLNNGMLKGELPLVVIVDPQKLYSGDSKCVTAFDLCRGHVVPILPYGTLQASFTWHKTNLEG